MSKVYLYSDIYLPTFPFLESKLYNRLKKEGVDVVFVMRNGDYRSITPGLKEHFEFAVMMKDPKKELPRLMGAKDLCVMRFGYKGETGDVGNAIVGAGKKLLMLDPAAVDVFFRECPAQYITVKSKWVEQRMLKKINKRYKGVFITGTIHFDDVVGAKCNKKDFMESYGLKPEKKLAILTPANPAEGNAQVGIDRTYAEIAQIVQSQCSEYDLMIKAHPNDYNAKIPKAPGIIHKHEYYQGKHSWESFAPGVKVVRADEGYKAFSCADVVINVRSSISMEVPFFNTPLLNVNRGKYTTNWPDSKNEGVMKDIKIEDLADVLNKGAFKVDRKARDEYLLNHCTPALDGKAYERTAEVIKNIIGG